MCTYIYIYTIILSFVAQEHGTDVGRLKFNYLISIYGISKDPPGLVMEYMRKGSLDNLLSSHVLMWPKKFQMVHEMTMGMNFLHSMKPPILHLNLKPANILLDDHLHIKVSQILLLLFKMFLNLFLVNRDFIKTLQERELVVLKTLIIQLYR